MISTEKLLWLEDFMTNKIDKNQLINFLNKEYSFLEFTTSFGARMRGKELVKASCALKK